LAHPELDLVSGEALVRWLELSGKEVYDLRKAGVLVRDRQRFGLRRACGATVNTCGARLPRKTSCTRQTDMAQWNVR